MMRLRFLLPFLCLFLSVAVRADDLQKQQLRLIVLAPHLVESMYEIGAGDQIIATTDHSDYPQAASSIPRIGNYARLQIEKILQLRPDVVVAWRTGNPAEDLLRLEKYNINVVYTQPGKLEDVAEEIRLLGQITGRDSTANRIADDYLMRLETLKNRYNSAMPVSVFYELWARPLRTVAGEAWLQQQIAVCGGDNIFASIDDDYPQVSLEQVLSARPQIIIQPSTHGRGQPDKMDWQKWPNIPAVENAFILTPDADKVHRMTTRMLGEVESMCEGIDKARRFYASNE